MTAKKRAFDEVHPSYSVSLQGGWPMVENAMHQQRVLRSPASETDAQADRIAKSVEAATGLPRTGGPPPSLDREMARALVDAGYMPLADYVALYGDDAAVAGPAPRPDQAPTMQLIGRIRAAFGRRQTYRVASVRYTFAKPPPRRAGSRRKA